MNINDQKSKLCLLTVLAAAMLISSIANAADDPNVVRTTRDFGPPMPFGTAGQGMIFEGKPYAGRQVVQVRIYWDIVVAEGFDAADILAFVNLPILPDPDHLVNISLDGADLGWSGSGPFSYHEVTDKYNYKFGPVWTPYDWWFTGPWDPVDTSVMWPLDAVEVLPSSRIEIDYLIPCEYDLAGDLNKDCRIDLVDLAMLAANWLSDCALNPADPGCFPKE